MGEKKNKVKINIVKGSKSRQKIRKFDVFLPNLDHSIKCFVENHKLSQLTDRTMTGWFGMVKHTFSQQTRLLYSAGRRLPIIQSHDDGKRTLSHKSTAKYL